MRLCKYTHRFLHRFVWLTFLFKLHFALTDATHWVSHYNGFNYEEFYEFIIDFFEANQTAAAAAASKELFDWWNKYVSVSILLSLLLISPRRVFPRSAATRATSSTSVRQSSLAVLQEQRRARLSRSPA